MTAIKEPVELVNCRAIKANNIVTNNVIRILEIRDPTIDRLLVTALVIENLGRGFIEIMDTKTVDLGKITE